MPVERVDLDGRGCRFSFDLDGEALDGFNSIDLLSNYVSNEGLLWQIMEKEI